MPERIIAVTGSASGIGAALTSLLREQGVRVIGVDLSDAEVIADLGTPAGRLAAAEGIKIACGGELDGIVTCAGISLPLELTVKVNYFGTTELVDALRPLFALSPAPRIAVVGSINGTRPPDEALLSACLNGDESAAVAVAAIALDEGRGAEIYATSKTAIAQWVRRTSVLDGWANEGVALNAVAPGIVLTPLSEAFLADPVARATAGHTVPMPLNGYLQPEDVARVLAFLVGVENTHITGQILYVDGGAEAVLAQRQV